MGANNSQVLLALGSRGRSDDAVGLVVAEQLRETLTGCRIVTGQDDPMAILNAWEDASLACVIDAAVSGAAPGHIHRFELENRALPRELARCSSHGAGLAEAIELGRVLKRLPARLMVFAVEAGNLEHGDTLSEPVMQSSRIVAQEILSEIESSPVF